ncbi:hypothetical protein JMJ55_29210 [Belnapia sp. T6]|uniref:Uncharacterized protein n=1 Tax=Belnapia mucosa TaxID=2804532 RepID=A0ABS1VCL2_9PROT|nr:hypothetical protein [Belnapia mucosa]MBL6459399.1 hypothetical protein [Belnapia mucosa]
MRRTASTASHPSRAEGEPPTPPPGGWTLMEAAEALCPDAAALYRQERGVLRPVMFDGDSINLFEIWGHSAGWLSHKLLEALCGRPDLVLTGQNLERGADADRYRMPHSLLVAAANRDVSAPLSAYRAWVSLELDVGSVLFGFRCFDDDWPVGGRAKPEDVKLVTVRIEAASAAGETPYGVAAGRVAKMTYSLPRCRAWFRLRIDGWPEGHPLPNRGDCYAAARAYFAGPIDRTEFRKIRSAIVPDPWKARGRRSATKTAQC